MLISKCSRQPAPAAAPMPSPASVLDGDTQVPSARMTGLFLIGPSTPSGKRRGADHVWPPSGEVITIPHQLKGSGPTL
ncbi:hypothetical protein D3C81_1381500 [compost metagenome]